MQYQLRHAAIRQAHRQRPEREVDRRRIHGVAAREAESHHRLEVRNDGGPSALEDLFEGLVQEPAAGRGNEDKSRRSGHPLEEQEAANRQGREAEDRGAPEGGDVDRARAQPRGTDGDRPVVDAAERGQDPVVERLRVPLEYFSGQEGERQEQHQNPYGTEEHRELAPIARRQIRHPSPPPARARVDAHPAIMTSFERAPPRAARRA